MRVGVRALRDDSLVVPRRRHRVIREVTRHARVRGVVGRGREPNQSLVVQVRANLVRRRRADADAAPRGDEDVRAQVDFSSVDEERTRDVRLDDVRRGTPRGR